MLAQFQESIGNDYAAEAVVVLSVEIIRLDLQTTVVRERVATRLRRITETRWYSAVLACVILCPTPKVGFSFLQTGCEVADACRHSMALVGRLNSHPPERTIAPFN